MPAPNPLPKYVYKILDGPPPTPIPAEFPLSDLDKQDGFIHLSTAKQVLRPSPPPSRHPAYTNSEFQIPITASLFFKSHTTLYLVKIHYAPIASAAKWDDPPNDNDGCPHLYGRGLGKEEVEGVKTFERTGEKGWDEVFAGDDGWLE